VSLPIFSVRTFYLFAWLVFVMLVYPYLSDFFGLIIAGVSIAFIPVAGVYAVSDSRRSVIIGLVFGIPSILSTLYVALVGGDNFTPRGPYAFFMCTYYAITTIMIFIHVMKARRVTLDTLFGAASVYLLIGFTFATLFMAIQVEIPGAFRGPPEEGFLEFADMLYYSFVTLTTLGYGEITPATSHSQSLAMVEAVVGVMYMAIIVARLVSLYQSTKSDREE